MEGNNSKRNKGLIITLVITIIIILGLTVYILYDKGVILKSIKNNETAVEGKTNNSKKENQQNDSNSEQSIDINSDIVQNLYSMFKIDTLGVTADSLNNDNLIKLLLAYKNIPEHNLAVIQCSKLGGEEKYRPNSQVSLFCGESLSDEQENYTSYLNANLLEAKVHMLFGSDYKISHESFNVDCSHTMIYNKEQNIYALYGSNTGCMSAHEPQELLAASKKGDELYMKTALKDLNNGSVVSNINYTFKKDPKNDNYVFVNVVEEKS